MTDLMNVFYELDVERTGVVCLADFERLMLQLSFGPDVALRLFQRLDTDGDGALSLLDWTSENSKNLAEMLCFRVIRQRLVGRNPVKAQMPTPSVSSHLNKNNDFRVSSGSNINIHVFGKVSLLRCASRIYIITLEMRMLSCSLPIRRLPWR